MPGRQESLPLGALSTQERRLVEVVLDTRTLGPESVRPALLERAANPTKPFAVILLDSYLPGDALDRLLEILLDRHREVVDVADELRGQGKIVQAAAKYGEALRMRERDAATLLRRGIAYALLQQYDLSLADLDRSIEIDPANASAYNVRGVLRHKEGQFDLAQSDLSRAVELSPRGKHFFDRGVFYQRRGRMELAAADYERAVELDPMSPQAWNNLAITRCAQGDFAAGIAAICDAVRCSRRAQDRWIRKNAAVLLQYATGKDLADAAEIERLRSVLDDVSTEAGWVPQTNQDLASLPIAS